jgi:choline-sulfatase
MSTRPNILLIMADQMAAPALPPYGHKEVKAPNIVALANDGVVFENAYCNFPLCAPSRFSMLAGRLPSAIEAFDNASEFPASTPTLPHYLQGVGYHTILSGKMHFIGPDQLHGFAERLTTDIYPADFEWTPDWTTGEYGFYSPGMNWQTVAESGPCFRSLQIDYDDEVERKSIQKLYDLAREARDEPFFMCVSFTHPHPPYCALEEYWGRYEGESIDLPSVPGIPLDRMDMMSRWVQFTHGLHEHALPPAAVRNARRAYYGMISYVDDKVGRLLESLSRCDFAKNTIVVFTVDHGDMLGERGMWYKRAFFEWSARVPLIVHYPQRFAPHRVRKVVSLVDLLPTLLDLATEGKQPHYIDPLAGSSMVKLLEGSDPGWPDAAISEYMAEGVTGPCRMIRHGAFKYIYTDGHPDQLFDLTSDPSELENIAARKPEIVDLLRKKLFAGWDPAEVKQRVLASQRRRLFMKDLPSERKPSWDYQAMVDDSKRFVRGGSAREIKGRRRWPPISPARGG